MKCLIVGMMAAGLVAFGARQSAAQQVGTSAITTEAEQAQVPTQAMPLATVRIPRAVKANGDRLAPGTYRVRLSGDSVKAEPGETPNLEQWVEFLQGDTVEGNAVASIVTKDHIKEIEREAPPKAGTARVEMLKGGDYLRVWINKNGNSYLIHLPVES